MHQWANSFETWTTLNAALKKINELSDKI